MYTTLSEAHGSSQKREQRKECNAGRQGEGLRDTQTMYSSPHSCCGRRHTQNGVCQQSVMGWKGSRGPTSPCSTVGYLYIWGGGRGAGTDFRCVPTRGAYRTVVDDSTVTQTDALD